jgi:hypothetical protein
MGVLVINDGMMVIVYKTVVTVLLIKLFIIMVFY